MYCKRSLYSMGAKGDLLCQWDTLHEGLLWMNVTQEKENKKNQMNQVTNI